MLDETLPVTTLLVIRHARTVWNAEERYAGHQEVALAPEAQQQIQRLTHQLIQEPISTIYSSPLSRCLLTVGPTAEILNLTVGIDERLRERNLGNWEGVRAADIAREHPGFHFPDSAYSGNFSIPKAETLPDLQTRAVAVFSDIARRNSGKTVLIATHAGVIWAVENRFGNHKRWPENSTIIRMIWRAEELVVA